MIQARPFNRCKGRFWRASQNGVVIGEFKTYQDSLYEQQPKRICSKCGLGDLDHSGEPCATAAWTKTYGRGGGKYTSKMVRTSWLAPLGENTEHLNTERIFNEWKAVLQALPLPGVRKISA